MAVIRDLLGHGIYDDLSAVFVGIAYPLIYDALLKKS
jgi:hypothetical protein